MNRIAKISYIGNRIKCSCPELTIKEGQYLFANGFSLWYDCIYTNKDVTCLLLLTVKLNELGYKIVLE